jgi:hypothetical protein
MAHGAERVVFLVEDLHVRARTRRETRFRGAECLAVHVDEDDFGLARAIEPSRAQGRHRGSVRTALSLTMQCSEPSRLRGPACEGSEQP